jgi:hypothetical protein
MIKCWKCFERHFTRYTWRIVAINVSIAFSRHRQNPRQSRRRRRHRQSRQSRRRHRHRQSLWHL